jgi:hypothetical protein
VKEWDEDIGLLCFMISAAIFRVAETSEWSWSRALSHSSAVGICEVKITEGRNSGWKPYQISKGECPVAL